MIPAAGRAFPLFSAERATLPSAEAFVTAVFFAAVFFRV
jgi:hypothetical protein